MQVRSLGLIPGLGRSPGEGNSNLVQCSCLENPTDRGAWRATVHGVAKSRTRLKRLNPHAYDLKGARPASSRAAPSGGCAGDQARAARCTEGTADPRTVVR